MKKVFLTLALAAFAFAANAQFVVSGNFGFNHNGEKYVVDGKDAYNQAGLVPDYTFNGNRTKETNFNFNLKGGYQLTEQIQAGLLLGFESGTKKTEAPSLADPTKADLTTTKSHIFSIGVYGRYNVVEFNKLTLFAEGSLAMAMGGGKTEVKPDGGATTTTDAPKTFGLGINIVPGLSYRLTDHISAELYLDIVSLGFNMEKTTWNKDIAPSSTEETFTETEFGFNARTTNMSINNFFDAVRIGVAFNF